MTENTVNNNWPIFRSLAAVRLSNLPGDLIAGLTLAAIAIPEQMATARLGGFSPQIGFFAFMAATNELWRRAYRSTGTLPNCQSPNISLPMPHQATE